MKNINESGFARITNIIRGIVPKIQTFGIVTAFNPNNEQLPSDINNKLNAELEHYIKAGNFGYVKGKSDYGKFERPFFIPNIKRSEILKFGYLFKQESVIFGEKSNDHDGMDIYLLYSDRPDRMGKLDSQAKIFLNTERNAFYSEFSGRKFFIPFFDAEKEFEFEKGSGVVKDPSKLDETLIDKINSIVSEYLCENKTNSWKQRGRLKTEIEMLNNK
jgi:hypothetical protein